MSTCEFSEFSREVLQFLLPQKSSSCADSAKPITVGLNLPIGVFFFCCIETQESMFKRGVFYFVLVDLTQVFLHNDEL